MGTTNKFEPKSSDLSEYAGVDNNSMFAFRVVTEFESTATGSGINGYVTTSSVSYTTVGTIRFDLVGILGDRLPAIDPTARLGFLTISNGFQCAVTGAPRYNYVVQGADSLDETNWFSIVTNVGTFTFTDTNSPSQPQRFYRALLLP
jgi:hypothetical protein